MVQEKWAEIGGINYIHSKTIDRFSSNYGDIMVKSNSYLSNRTLYMYLILSDFVLFKGRDERKNLIFLLKPVPYNAP